MEGRGKKVEKMSKISLRNAVPMLNSDLEVF